VSTLIERNVNVSSGRPIVLWLGLLVFGGAAATTAFLSIGESYPTMRALLIVMSATMFICSLAYARALMARRGKHQSVQAKGISS
jgi:hypothetical protein